MQQIGTAREIYEAPVNRFVADFIGETNLLQVEVDSVSNGTGHRSSCPAVTRLTCPAASNAVGANTACLDPPRTHHRGRRAAAIWTVTVDRVVYLGTDLQLLARLVHRRGHCMCACKTRHAAPVPAIGSHHRRCIWRKAPRAFWPTDGRVRTQAHQGGHLRGYGRIVGPLLMPTWVMIGIFLVLPVLLMVVYSFLTKEFRGGVIWEFSPGRL